MELRGIHRDGLDDLVIAVQGCGHGALVEIYASLLQAEARAGVTADLLICCGDFQAVRGSSPFRGDAVQQCVVGGARTAAARAAAASPSLSSTRVERVLSALRPVGCETSTSSA